jgi:hypothetical protein
MSMDGWSYAIGATADLANTGLGLYQSSKAFRRAKEMYQHRYQWAVDDMRKAGLNPVLAATGGGVSTGGLNAGSITPAGRLGENFSKSSANELASAQKDLLKMQTEAALSASTRDFNTAQYMHALKDQVNVSTEGIKQANDARGFYVNWLKKNPDARSFGYLINSLTGGATLPQAVNSAISAVR